MLREEEVLNGTMYEDNMDKIVACALAPRAIFFPNYVPNYCSACSDMGPCRFLWV